jgi:hypothetical protein
MTTDTASPLRQRMIEDMNARKFCADTPQPYLCFSKRRPPQRVVTRLVGLRRSLASTTSCSLGLTCPRRARAASTIQGSSTMRAVCGSSLVPMRRHSIAGVDASWGHEGNNQRLIRKRDVGSGSVSDRSDCRPRGGAIAIKAELGELQ